MRASVLGQKFVRKVMSQTSHVADMWGRLQSARGFSPDSHSFGGAKNSAQAEAWLKPAPHFAGQTFAMNF